ncbi:transmembrane protease serine 9-like [Musca vetustissima]|uniref:transmembrane protease serine 9-like n=1 Tax=Musca vetustissima TaxID=27455 RepID=UPI002AB7AFAF|nr:transmembrane protease serine 9-like [Musca vetustissima]
MINNPKIQMTISGVIIITIVFVFQQCQGSTLPPDASLRDAIPSKESKIIGGSQISINDAKYQVSLRLVANENSRGFGYGHICGGSIISQRVILTAAHCCYNTDPETERRAGEFKVVVGSTQLYVKEPNVLEYYVQQMVKHAGFDPVSMINDIALVMINGYIPWNWPTARAIHLNAMELNMGVPCNVSGWGKTERGLIPNNLLSTVVRSISYDECEASYGHIPLSMICAGDYYVGGVDACQGDSGGPMVCANSQVGIVSWVCAPRSDIFGIGRLQDPRIINGTEATLANTKHQVSIRRRINDDYYFGMGHICGGSLISENVVLCAGHCFTEQVFNFSTYEDDIVVIILNGTVPADHPTVKPIVLNDGELKNGTVCQVTGWGVTEEGYNSDVLMTVDVPYIPPNVCRKESAYLELIRPGMMCAGYLEGERDACQGDSGGPLVCNNRQAGITSWGSGCALPLKPGVYTDVAFYKDWIFQKIAENNGTLPKFAGNGSMSINNGSMLLAAIVVTLCAPPSDIFGIGRPQDPRIINGTVATLANTKHQVSIRRRLNDGYFFGTGHICGGSLISENVVLCAGHCFTDQVAFNGSYLPDEDFIVVMGNLDRFEQNENTLRFDIKKVEKYRQVFNFSSYEDDIVVVILNGTVPANHTTVKPIVLNDGELKNGTVCQVTGWGVTEEGYSSDVLMTLDVPYIPPNVCRKESAYAELIKPGMMCAGYLEGERDACQGDSGGPLVCKNVQAGITSWGSGCAQPLKPGVYTDVAYYKDWILQKVTENNGTLPKFAGNGSISINNGSMLLAAILVTLNVIFKMF